MKIVLSQQVKRFFYLCTTYIIKKENLGMRYNCEPVRLHNWTKLGITYESFPPQPPQTCWEQRTQPTEEKI